MPFLWGAIGFVLGIAAALWCVRWSLTPELGEDGLLHEQHIVLRKDEP